MALWDDIGREIRHLWEILTTGEASPDEDTRLEEEEESTEPGGFFGGDEPPDRTPGSGGFFDDIPDEEPPSSYEEAGDGGYFTYHAGQGPYGDNWGEREIRFWDTQFDQHMFDNQNHYNETIPLFYDAYMAGDDEISREDRKQARFDFKEWTYIVDINWDAFKEYYSDM